MWKATTASSKNFLLCSACGILKSSGPQKSGHRNGNVTSFACKYCDLQGTSINRWYPVQNDSSLERRS